MTTGIPPQPRYEDGQPAAGAELMTPERRAVAVQALADVSLVIGGQVNIAELTTTAGLPVRSDARTRAKRTLRALVAVLDPDSGVVERVGPEGIYHFVEGTIDYGANQETYLSLMSEHGLTPEEVTGLYAFRDSLAQYTDGKLQTFPYLIKALESVGIDLREVLFDPDAATRALYEAGHIINYRGGTTYDAPMLWRGRTPPQRGRYIDDDRSYGATEALIWARRFAEEQRVGIDDIDLEEDVDFELSGSEDR